VEARPAVFGVLQLRFEFEGSGAIRRSIVVQTAAADDHPDIVHKILDIAWIVLVVCLVMQVLYRLILLLIGRASPHSRCCDVGTFLDCITILLSVALFTSRTLATRSASDLRGRMVALPTAPVRGASDQALQDYHHIWGKVLDDALGLVVWEDFHRCGLFIYTVVLTVQFLEAFRGQPKLAQLANALMHAVVDALHFFLIFLVLLLNFAFSGFMVFGLTLEEWSTMGRALNTTLQALTGGLDLEPMYKVAPISSVVWYWLFLSVMVFLLLNLLLAITFDHYVIIKVNCGQSTGVFTQMKDIVRDQLRRAWESSYISRCLCCCLRRDSTVARPLIPQHGILLDEMMLRAGLPPEECRAIRGSVLGAKWHRTARERKLFAEGKGGADTEQVSWAMASAEADLKALNVDPEYVDSLVDGCIRHSKREFDAEEVKLAQLRALVHRAEAEMAGMRDRLADCYAASRGTLLGVGGRIEVLERLVHAALADAAAVAGAAGVPDAKPGRNHMEQTKLANTLSSLRSLSPRSKSQSVSVLTGSVSQALQRLGSPEPMAPKTGVDEWTRAKKVLELGRTNRMLPPPKGE